MIIIFGFTTDICKALDFIQNHATQGFSMDCRITYVANLIHNLQAALRDHDMVEKLRFLLYPTKLLPADKVRIQADDAGVFWL